MLEVVRDRPMVGALPVVAALLSVTAIADADAGATLCVFRRCTGGYCPGCGGGRSVWALLHGDLARSWSLHPWVPLIVAQLMVIGLAVLWFGRQPVQRVVVPVLVANCALGATIWAARLATGAIPIPFG